MGCGPSNPVVLANGEAGLDEGHEQATKISEHKQDYERGIF